MSRSDAPGGPGGLGGLSGRGRWDRSPAELQAIIAAERAGRPFLVWRAGAGTQRILGLEPERWRVTIGRDDDADVSLADDAEVSRLHALLERVGQEWTLVDDGLSRNGSFINRVKVLGRRRLLDGDVISCGASEITYREPAAARGNRTVSSARPSLPALSPSPMQRRILIALCRPVHQAHGATPATNRQIAAEVHLSVDAVKAHLRVLFERAGLGDLPQNEKRAQLVSTVLLSGTVTSREFESDGR